MTIKELSGLYNIRKRLQEQNELLAMLEARAEKTTATITGMPHGSGISDKTGTGGDMADVKQVILDLQNAEQAEFRRLCLYIAQVPDAHIAKAMRLRFLDGLSWRAVARRMGGGNTEDGVRKAVFRYVEER